MRGVPTSVCVLLSFFDCASAVVYAQSRTAAPLIFEIFKSSEKEVENGEESWDTQHSSVKHGLTSRGAIYPVVDLTPFNFGAVMNSMFVDHWLVSYCHDWYAPCQRSNLFYKRKARSYLIDQINAPIRFAAVDCSSHKTLCNEKNVHSFPTVQHYSKGIFIASLVGSDPFTFDRFIEDIEEERYVDIFPPSQVLSYFYNLSKKKSIKPELAEVQYLMYGNEFDDGSSGKSRVTEAYVKFDDGNKQVVPITFVSGIKVEEPNYAQIAALTSLAMANVAFLLTAFHTRVAQLEAQQQRHSAQEPRQQPTYEYGQGNINAEGEGAAAAAHAHFNSYPRKRNALSRRIRQIAVQKPPPDDEDVSEGNYRGAGASVVAGWRSAKREPRPKLKESVDDYSDNINNNNNENNMNITKYIL